jgi:hypothetical protein
MNKKIFILLVFLVIESLTAMAPIKINNKTVINPATVTLTPTSSTTPTAQIILDGSRLSSAYTKLYPYYQNLNYFIVQTSDKVVTEISNFIYRAKSG